MAHKVCTDPEVVLVSVDRILSVGKADIVRGKVEDPGEMIPRLEGSSISFFDGQVEVLTGATRGVKGNLCDPEILPTFADHSADRLDFGKQSWGLIPLCPFNSQVRAVNR